MFLTFSNIPKLHVIKDTFTTTTNASPKMKDLINYKVRYASLANIPVRLKDVDVRSLVLEKNAKNSQSVMSIYLIIKKKKLLRHYDHHEVLGHTTTLSEALYFR